MQKDISSPFTPGIPVPVDYFVGRETELQRLLDKVKDSTHGSIEVEFLSGEGGIGKSSLASFLRHIAETQMNVLGAHVFLGGTTSLEEMARRVIEELILESRDKKWYDSVIDPVRQYVKSVGLFNVSIEFRPPDEILRAAVGNFADTLRGFYGKLSREKDGLLIILDDINGLAESLDFANWFKSFVDGIGVSRFP